MTEALDSDPDGWTRHLPWILAALTVAPFLVGYVRMTARYAPLGILDHELSLTLQDFMVESIPVVLMPLTASFLVFLLHQAGREVGRKSPLQLPSPHLRVGLGWENLALLVSVFWLFHQIITMDHPRPPVFLGLSKADCSFLGLTGGIAFLGAAISSRIDPAPIPKRVPPWVRRFTQLLLIGGMIGLAVGGWIPWWGATLIVACLAALKILSLPKVDKALRKRKPPPWLVSLVLGFASYAERLQQSARIGRKTFAWFAAVYFLVVAGIFHGLGEGQSAATNCGTLPIISSPENPLLDNRTYWVVLHENDIYYLRDVTQARENKTSLRVEDSTPARIMFHQITPCT